MKRIIRSLLLILVFNILLYADMLDFYSISYDNAKYSASSVLKEKGKPDNYYGPAKAFDNDSGTAWCEGKSDDGIGESVSITVSPVKIYGVGILNGYGKYKHLYMQNNRVKDFRLTFYPPSGKEKVVTGTFGKDLCGMYLEKGDLKSYCEWKVEEKEYTSYEKCVAAKKNDCFMDDYEGGGQKIMLKTPMTVKQIKLEILSVYKGEKFSDTCISAFTLVSYNTGDYPPYEKNNKYPKY
ncbi:MAG TPA: discoidin domain-containing protein [Spirochaetota bacterium]|nr:discoidin domain-containing protein [Spirochaetota bacterium]HPF06388.1 discoidin domain-containing protein [Spirochaetota bacterium]HPJ41869.1 discoidin domain-containing protein [Spirochaetota bacterium]HPR36837.1 discoidin domain-containing protein [Spirochaetota bacterium]HRX46376.1 discoidin domain-containing protein [Spirochaetota bacterium]